MVFYHTNREFEISSTESLVSGNKDKCQAVFKQERFATWGIKQQVTFMGDFHHIRAEHGVVSMFSGLFLKTDWCDATKIP